MERDENNVLICDFCPNPATYRDDCYWPYVAVCCDDHIEEAKEALWEEASREVNEGD